MEIDTPFLVEDIGALRNEIMNLDRKNTEKAKLWNLLKTSARSAPMDFGWFVPFVALMTREKQDVDNARKIIFTYIDKLDKMDFCSGLQYHFWCFAFPHAKISMYFQWLCTIGAFTGEEISSISGRLVEYHFVNFYYGMRTKPEPECVDNQTFSLCLSNTIVGFIFSGAENPSKMAEIMLRDGLRRLPGVLGDMPVSGYSGEGSSYMDCVNGPAVPLTVEVLERITGEQNLLYKSFEPNQVKPVSVLRMVAREFMPGGLLLPWDNYGYQYGVRSTLAYGAKKTGESVFYDTLDKECIWTYDIGIGWAYDDLVWTLIWWSDRAVSGLDSEANWFEPITGGTLVSSDRNRYAIQMWDESSPVIPTRAHVNPNAVLFNGFKTPISADGSPTPGKKHRFMFEDTWRYVNFLAIDTDSRYNYGDGCGGAHSVILVDGTEGLRASSDYPQVLHPLYSPGELSVSADVTPIYQDNFEDIRKVARKTQLHCDTFFTVEDVFEAGSPHRVTSRFLFRPGTVPCSRGVKVVTPEGVTLHLFDLLNENEITTEFVEHHPFKPDGCSEIVDFSLEGSSVRRLFVVFISNTIQMTDELTGFRVTGDRNSEYDYAKAVQELDVSDIITPMKLPAYMEKELPNLRTWWYQKTVAKNTGKAYLQLPRGIIKPRLFLNGTEIDLRSYEISQELIAPRVPVPAEFESCSTLDIVFKTDVPVGHYDGGGDGTVGMSGGLWLGYPIQEEVVEEAGCSEGRIYLRTNVKEYTSQYNWMAED